MSIAINSNFERDQYQAAAAQTVFNFSFPIFSETYIKVYRRLFAQQSNDADDLLILGTDYTVTGVNEEAGGFITLVVPCVANEIITLVGEEPIERESVFQDSNPFTIALNQQLNEQTVMQQQTYTYWNHVTPRYYFSELVSDEVRPLKRILPMLPNGYVWMGRGELGEDPDDIIPVWLGDFDALGLLDVDYVIGHPHPALPNAQPLSELPNGIMVNIDGTVRTNIIEGGPGIVVTNGDGQDPDAPIVVSLDGGGSSVSKTIVQEDHGLSKYMWIRPTATPPLPNYVPGLATTGTNAEIMGTVTEIIDEDTFTMQQSGYLENLEDHPNYPLTPLACYFLSSTISGAMSLTKPSSNGLINKPVFVADTDASGWVLPLQRGQVNGGTDGGGGGGGTDSNKQTFTQVGHDFELGEIVRIMEDTGVGIYVRALADSFVGAQSVGMIVELNVDGDPDKFVVQSEGWVDILSGLPIETLHYLSPTVPGAMTTVRPTDPSHYVRPIFIAYSDGTGWLLEQQPLSVPVADSQNIQTITQVAHGFVAKDCVRVDNAGTTYIKAIATSIQNATTAGIVIKKIDDDTFMIQQSGETNLITGMTPGQRYWLSSSVAGQLTAVEPTANGTVSKLMYVAKLAAQGQIQEQRPMLQPNANGGGDAGGGGPGTPIQVKYVAKTDTSSFGLSYAFVNISGLVITITPTSADNPIVIEGYVNVGGYYPLMTRVTRDGTPLPEGAARATGITSGYYPNGSGIPRAVHAFKIVDEPATTDPVEYRIQVYSGPANYVNASWNGSSEVGISTMWVSEILPFA